VEAGERASLAGEYPTELVGLADNLNALIETERRRLERYRHTIDDLAHALKTPLAAMRTLLAEVRSKAQSTPPAQLASLAHELGRRGKREDESVPGQGIGLAVVRETVELYRGALTVGRSELGGAEIQIELARAGAP